MQCFLKKEDKSPIDVDNFKLLISTTVLSLPHLPHFCYSFVSSVSVLLLSLYVQFT